MAGSKQDEDDGLIAGINVTPLVDVTLVLLVIMMVSAKLIVSSGLSLELPRAKDPTDEVSMLFSIDVDAEGHVTIDRERVGDDEIRARAEAALAKRRDVRAVIRADASARHGRVVAVIDRLRQAKMHRIAFAVAPLTEP
jgi:biopolymer transport protein ExbD